MIESLGGEVVIYKQGLPGKKLEILEKQFSQGLVQSGNGHLGIN